jgi:pimeloyl-ACP methyl ester carboxylesterase
MAGVVGIGALFGFGRGNRTMKRLCRLTRLAKPLLLEQTDLNTVWIGRAINRIYGLADVLGYGFPIAGWYPGSIERELLEERLERGFDWTSIKIWTEMSEWSERGSFNFAHLWRNVDVPVYVMVGDRDCILPLEDARGAYDLSGSEDRTLQVFDDYENQVHWGHLDLILGRWASQHTWPALDEWMSGRQA